MQPHRVTVVVDGASALPASLAEQHGIVVVPMMLVIDGNARPDTEVPMQELTTALATAEVSTSGPAPGDFMTALDRARQQSDQLVVLTLAQEMSSTHASAAIAAAEVGGALEVLDTRTAAGAEGLVALAAARRAAEGADLDDVLAAARAAMARVHLVAAVDDLTHLVRSGRVPGLAARAAGAVHLVPLFEFREGAAHACGTAHGERGAARRIVHRCLAERPEGGHARLHVAALDAQAPERAQRLVDDVLAEVPDADWFIGSFGPVMVAHVGPGLFGLAWWWEPLI